MTYRRIENCRCIDRCAEEYGHMQLCVTLITKLEAVDRYKDIGLNGGCGRQDLGDASKPDFSLHRRVVSHDMEIG